MSNSDSEQQKARSRERRSGQRSSLMIAHDHSQPVAKKKDHEQPKKKKGGGLGAFFKMNTPADNGGAGKDCDDASRGGYSTVSKMFRAKSRKTKQPAAYLSHQQEQGQDNYMDKLDSFLTRQHERTARREILDSDEQSRGAYSTVGRLQHMTTTGTANHRSPRKPSSRNLTSSSSASVKSIKSSTSRNIGNSHKSSRQFGASTAAATTSGGTTTDRKVQELERQQVTRSKAQHSGNSISSTTKERSKSRPRSKRSDSGNDAGGDHHRSMPSINYFSSSSSSPRKQLTSAHSSSRRHRSGNSDASKTVKKNSSRTTLSPVKEKTKSPSRRSSSKHHHSNSDSHSNNAALIETHEPLQFAPGGAPTPLTFLPDPSNAGKTIQVLPSNNAKPLLVVAPPEKEENGPVDNASSSANQNQHSNGSINPSISQQASSSSRNKQTHAKGPPTQPLSSSSTSRCREMEEDHSSKNHRKGSSRAKGGEHNHHLHGELTSPRSSRRRSSKANEDSLIGEQQLSASAVTTSHESFCKRRSSGGRNAPGDSAVVARKERRSSDRKITVGDVATVPKKERRTSENRINSGDAAAAAARKERRCSNGKIAPNEAAREGTSRRRRSSGGSKSISVPRHSGGQSSLSSSSAHARGKTDGHGKNNNNLTETQERGRRGSNRDRSGNSSQNNISSRNRHSSQRREQHLSQQDSVERESANDDVVVTSTCSDACVNEETGKEEGGGGEHEGDADDDDDEATFAEPSEVIEKLKTSHLRRLVEPPRRVARNVSQSSNYSSTVGSVSSRCDDSAVVSRSLRKPMRKASEHSASSWRPPHRRRSADVNNNDLEKASFEIEMNHQRRKTDCAPVTPQRRTSGGSYNSYSVKSCIEEEGEESSSSPKDFVEFDRIEEDVFSIFAWSTAKQDPVAIERERKRMRDVIYETPFYQAYKSTGIPDGQVAR